MKILYVLLKKKQRFGLLFFYNLLFYGRQTENLDQADYKGDGFQAVPPKSALIFFEINSITGMPWQYYKFECRIIQNQLIPL
jgi:hypothetical protein